MLVGGETFDGHPQIGAERRFGRVEAREKVALQGGGEETLGQIFGVLIVLAELEADESIDRLPIERDHALQGLVRQPGIGRLDQ